LRESRAKTSESHAKTSRVFMLNVCEVGVHSVLLDLIFTKCALFATESSDNLTISYKNGLF